MSDSRRNVLASGGTGALGQAVVRAFLEAGDRVVVPWIIEGERVQVEKAFADAVADGSLVLVAADVAEADGAAAAVKAAEPVSVLVNGAGGFAGGTPVWETELETWDQLYRMNLRTAVALSRAALPGMRERDAGCIVNVSATAVVSRPATLAAYTASKAGISVLTETLAHELAGTAVRVNAIAPTTIDTPANRAAMPDADRSGWTAPAAIAGVIRWLASDAAASVRGGIVPV
jgi:NAD(P)-dependent dehydrogenase (short-subunit alcohol dehydrogenase family)